MRLKHRLLLLIDLGPVLSFSASTQSIVAYLDFLKLTILRLLSNFKRRRHASTKWIYRFFDGRKSQGRSPRELRANLKPSGVQEWQSFESVGSHEDIASFKKCLCKVFEYAISQKIASNSSSTVDQERDKGGSEFNLFIVDLFSRVLLEVLHIFDDYAEDFNQSPMKGKTGRNEKVGQISKINKIFILGPCLDFLGDVKKDLDIEIFIPEILQKIKPYFYKRNIQVDWIDTYEFIPQLGFIGSKLKGQDLSFTKQFLADLGGSVLPPVIFYHSTEGIVQQTAELPALIELSQTSNAKVEEVPQFADNKKQLKGKIYYFAPKDHINKNIQNWSVLCDVTISQGYFNPLDPSGVSKYTETLQQPLFLRGYVPLGVKSPCHSKEIFCLYDAPFDGLPSGELSPFSLLLLFLAQQSYEAMLTPVYQDEENTPQMFLLSPITPLFGVMKPISFKADPSSQNLSKDKEKLKGSIVCLNFETESYKGLARGLAVQHLFADIAATSHHDRVLQKIIENRAQAKALGILEDQHPKGTCGQPLKRTRSGSSHTSHTSSSRGLFLGLQQGGGLVRERPNQSSMAGVEVESSEGTKSFQGSNSHSLVRSESVRSIQTDTRRGNFTGANEGGSKLPVPKQITESLPGYMSAVQLLSLFDQVDKLPLVSASCFGVVSAEQVHQEASENIQKKLDDAFEKYMQKRLREKQTSQSASSLTNEEHSMKRNRSLRSHSTKIESSLDLMLNDLLLLKQRCIDLGEPSAYKLAASHVPNVIKELTKILDFKEAKSKVFSQILPKASELRKAATENATIKTLRSYEIQIMVYLQLCTMHSPGKSLCDPLSPKKLSYLTDLLGDISCLFVSLSLNSVQSQQRQQSFKKFLDGGLFAHFGKKLPKTLLKIYDEFEQKPPSPLNKQSPDSLQVVPANSTEEKSQEVSKNDITKMQFPLELQFAQSEQESETNMINRKNTEEINPKVASFPNRKAAPSYGWNRNSSVTSIQVKQPQNATHVYLDEPTDSLAESEGKEGQFGSLKRKKRPSISVPGFLVRATPQKLMKRDHKVPPPRKHQMIPDTPVQRKSKTTILDTPARK